MHIDPTSGVPLFQQVADGIREDVAAGVLPPGSEAPSLRQLSAELRVNYHTVARAYHALEEEGVLTRQRGGAYMVADVATSAAAQLLEREIDALVRRADAMGCDDARLLDLVRARLAARRSA